MQLSKETGFTHAGSGLHRSGMKNGGGLMSPAEVQEILEWEKYLEWCEYCNQAAEEQYRAERRADPVTLY